MRQFIERFRVGCENKCLLSSLQCVIYSGFVSRVCIDYEGCVPSFLHLLCPGNPENLVGKDTLIYSEQKPHKFVILNF